MTSATELGTGEEPTLANEPHHGSLHGQNQPFAPDMSAGLAALTGECWSLSG